MRFVVRLLGLLLLCAGLVLFYKQAQVTIARRQNGDPWSTDEMLRIGGIMLLNTIALGMMFWHKVTDPHKILREKRKVQRKTALRDNAANALDQMTEGEE